MTMKEYYDLYLKKEDEGNCKVCGKVTKWDNCTKGYRDHCSSKCLQKNPEYRKKVNASIAKVDQEKASIKRQNTCIAVYGTDYVVKNEKIQEKIRSTCLDKYGSTTTLQLEHVKNARLKSLEENAEEINQKRKEWWTKENKECVYEKIKSTMLEMYDVENPFQLKEVIEKRKSYFKEKYGHEYMVMTDYFRQCMVDKHLWVPFEKLDEWHKYKLLVEKETRKNKLILFEQWDGKCYYLKKQLKHSDNSYDPYSITIDHKISKKYGFEHSISSEVIGSINNICVASRLINMIKNSMTEDQFIKSDKYRRIMDYLQNESK